MPHASCPRMSSSTYKQSKAMPFPLLSLPRELRDQVYQAFLDRTAATPRQYLDLLLVSRQVGYEAHAAMMEEANVIIIGLPHGCGLAHHMNSGSGNILTRRLDFRADYDPVIFSYFYRPTMHISIAEGSDTQRMLLRIVDHRPPQALDDLCWTIATYQHAVFEPDPRHLSYKVRLLTPDSKLPRDTIMEHGLLNSFRQAWFAYKEVSFQGFADLEDMDNTSTTVTLIPWSSRQQCMDELTRHLAAQLVLLRHASAIPAMRAICVHASRLPSAIMAAGQNLGGRLNALSTRTEALKAMALWTRQAFLTVNAYICSLVRNNNGNSAAAMASRLAHARSVAQSAISHDGIYAAIASNRRINGFAKANHALVIACAWVIIGNNNEIEIAKQKYELCCRVNAAGYQAGCLTIAELELQVGKMEAATVTE
jgi:hypothetical protein